MKKILKYAGIIIVLLAIAGFFLYLNKNEALPQGEAGAPAEAMALKMLTAIDKKAWDTTAYVQWSFPRGHDYIWNKAQDQVQVKWDVFTVLLNTKEVKGRVYQSGEEVVGERKEGLVQKAWSLFCNDSFWMAAPFKIMDPGVARSIVKLDDGRTGLKASYISGGVTPGDSYVWILDQQGMPTSYKMWVDIIPVGGMEFTWEEWSTLYTGAKIATDHQGVFSIPITNLKAAATLLEMGHEENIFEPLAQL